MATRSIRGKFLSNMLLISIVPIVGILIWNYLSDLKNYKDSVINEIEVARDMEEDRIEDYFQDFLAQLYYFSMSPGQKDAVIQFTEAFRQLEMPRITDEQEAELWHHYEAVIASIEDDSRTVIDLEQVFPRSPASLYLQYHYVLKEEEKGEQHQSSSDRYDSLFRSSDKGISLLVESYGLTDLMVIDNASGLVMYSYRKKLDMGMDLKDPRYSGDLPSTFRKISEMPEGSVIMTDFAPNHLARGRPRLLIAAPVYRRDESIATLVFQVGTDQVDRFMSRDEFSMVDSLGEEGTTRDIYLVGQDDLMRSSSRFYLKDADVFIENIRPFVADSIVQKMEDAETTVLVLPIRTEAVNAALRGERAASVGKDFRDRRVLNAYTPIEIEGQDIKWAVITQIDYGEAFEDANRFLLTSILFLLVTVAVIMLVANWLSGRITLPIRVLMDGTRQVENDNLEVELEVVSDDELATLTEMFNTMVAAVRDNRQELQRLYREVSEKQKEITDSINYALRIQHAALPERKHLEKEFKDSFIFFRPKDIVSGDYYWYHKLGSKFVITAADCTGHGVPGSFISLLGIRFLRRAIIDDRITRPDLILERLREELLDFFKNVTEDGDSIKDGMDLAICSYDSQSHVLEYAGAMNPLYHMRNGEVNIFKADRQPVSAQRLEETEPYTLHRINVEEGDTFYLFSDGFPDQMGGPRGKKFMSKKFRELLLEHHLKPLEDQNDILDVTLEDWMDGNEQTDDIIVLGFRPL